MKDDALPRLSVGGGGCAPCPSFASFFGLYRGERLKYQGFSDLPSQQNPGNKNRENRKTVRKVHT